MELPALWCARRDERGDGHPEHFPSWYFPTRNEAVVQGDVLCCLLIWNAKVEFMCVATGQYRGCPKVSGVVTRVEHKEGF